MARVSWLKMKAARAGVLLLAAVPSRATRAWSRAVGVVPRRVLAASFAVAERALLPNCVAR